MARPSPLALRASTSPARAGGGDSPGQSPRAPAPGLDHFGHAACMISSTLSVGIGTWSSGFCPEVNAMPEAHRIAV